ncbi:MAG: hypothetical protein OCU22_03060 [Canidatus Methanoxibalbensis ujae]|nr:hypothetical protein [Candidatus Methanoxibalbensis ujae]
MIFGYGRTNASASPDLVCGDFVCDGDETDDMLPLRGVEVDVS